MTCGGMNSSGRSSPVEGGHFFARFSLLSLLFLFLWALLSSTSIWSLEARASEGAGLGWARPLFPLVALTALFGVGVSGLSATAAPGLLAAGLVGVVSVAALAFVAFLRVVVELAETGRVGYAACSPGSGSAGPRGYCDAIAGLAVAVHLGVALLALIAASAVHRLAKERHARLTAPEAQRQATPKPTAKDLPIKIAV